ncbi:hypothetical protein IAD21_02364 [Abditibacteriota bacterium]|nr:hypothetical protein IAD21_02364 [Abditibacteriota bacterium]
MAMQSLSPSLPLNQADLQHEIERLFDAIEQMLDSTSSGAHEPLLPAKHWAYLPIDAEIEPVGNIC